MGVKVDLHVHSHYSSDSLITSKELVFYARKYGLDGVAIVDHDRLDGALAIAKETDFLVIPGIEISSANGHILGLNVQELVPPKLGVGETVEKVHDAGGIAVACHPMSFFKGSLGERADSRFDAVEVMNAAAFPFNYCMRRSEEIANRLKLPRVAGSDAHYGPEVGSAYSNIDAESNVNEIVEAVKKGLCQPFGGSIPLTTRLKRSMLVAIKKVKGGNRIL